MTNIAALFLKSKSDFDLLFFLIPFSYLLTLKGIEFIVRKRSVPAMMFIGTVLMIALGIAGFFVFIEQIPVPYWLLNLSLPFGAGTFLIFDEHPENSINARAIAFVIGVLCNALAMVCLVDFGKQLYQLNQEINKVGKLADKKEKL